MKISKKNFIDLALLAFGYFLYYVVLSLNEVFFFIEYLVNKPKKNHNFFVNHDFERGMIPKYSATDSKKIKKVNQC